MPQRKNNHDHCHTHRDSIGSICKNTVDGTVDYTPSPFNAKLPSKNSMFQTPQVFKTVAADSPCKDAWLHFQEAKQTARRQGSSTLLQRASPIRRRSPTLSSISHCCFKRIRSRPSLQQIDFGSEFYGQTPVVFENRKYSSEEGSSMDLLQSLGGAKSWSGFKRNSRLLGQR
ncbi:hypothetical protein HK100_009699, partial [Physocladia obscura]